MNQLTGQDILVGIRHLQSHPVSKSHDSRHYYVWFSWKHYPIKELIRRAMDIRFNQIESFGSKQAQKLLIDLGFPIIHEDFANPHDNFSEIELRSFERLTKRERYDKDDEIDANIGLFLTEMPWMKTKKWAERLKKKGWHIEGSRSWNVMHRTVGQYYKKYTWWKIYPKGYTNSNICFTVGIDTDGGVLYKMDIKRKANFFKMVPDREIRFDQIRDSFEESWPKIRKEDIQRFTIEELVNLSESYFTNLTDRYFEIVEELELMRPRKVARICWNIQQWTIPTGVEGKATDSFEGDNGFGHDEWLFDLDNEFNGKCYARLENVSKSSRDLIGATIDLLVFTRNKEKHRFEWVGEIKNVTILSKKGSAEFHESSEGQTLFEQRIIQLKELSEEQVNLDAYVNTPSSDMYNIAFDPADVTFFEKTIPESAVSYIIKLNRYKLLSINEREYQGIVTKQYTSDFEPDFDDVNTGDVNYKKTIRKTGNSYIREYENRHGRIQSELVAYLQNRFPSYTIRYEKSYTGIDRRRVDVVVEKSDSSKYFIEVKSYPHVGASIRIAIGQLLEYNYYPHSERAEKMIIVSDKVLDLQYESFLEKLRAKHNLQLYYLQFDLSKQELVGSEAVFNNS